MTAGKKSSCLRTASSTVKSASCRCRAPSVSEVVSVVTSTAAIVWRAMCQQNRWRWWYKGRLSECRLWRAYSSPHCQRACACRRVWALRQTASSEDVGRNARCCLLSSTQLQVKIVVVLGPDPQYRSLTVNWYTGLRTRLTTQRGRGNLVQLHTESHYGLQLLRIP